MSQMTMFAIAATVLLQQACQAAEFKLATVFSDHMVLQRDKPVPVWGWAEPGAKITVAFGEQKVTAHANETGAWKATLNAMSANAEPATLTVASQGVDRLLKVTDVLVGEVWLGSGQSNMAMTVNRANNFEQEKGASDLPQVRMFIERSKAMREANQDASGEWQLASPDTVGGFSATLFFFGRNLHKELDVPVGLINSSVGGTPIESWISAEAQAESVELQKAFEEANAAFEQFDGADADAKYQKVLERWQQQVKQARKDGTPIPQRPRNPADSVRRRGAPGQLYNGKIAPLIPYAIRGVVWYQGEANSQPGKGELYKVQLPLLVTDWRTRWGEELPFAWVQLPNFNRDGDGWSLVREAMLMTLSLPHTGMAITTDIGDPKDIHPKNKQDVGKRLAMWALGDVYGLDGVETSGPLPVGHQVQGREVIVELSHAKGLTIQGDLSASFELQDASGEWHPASAKIAAANVIVSSPEVKAPTSVRYNWTSNPSGNLVNAAGLPASPFRLSK